MTFDPSLLLSVVIALVGACVSYGMLRGALQSLIREVDKLGIRLDAALQEGQRSRDAQGERIGEVEERVAALEAVQEYSRPHRVG